MDAGFFCDIVQPLWNTVSAQCCFTACHVVVALKTRGSTVRKDSSRLRMECAWRHSLSWTSKAQQNWMTLHGRGDRRTIVLRRHLQQSEQMHGHFFFSPPYWKIFHWIGVLGRWWKCAAQVLRIIANNWQQSTIEAQWIACKVVLACHIICLKVLRIIDLTRKPKLTVWWPISSSEH